MFPLLLFCRYLRTFVRTQALQRCNACETFFWFLLLRMRYTICFAGDTHFVSQAMLAGTYKIVRCETLLRLARLRYITCIAYETCLFRLRNMIVSSAKHNCIACETWRYRLRNQSVSPAKHVYRLRYLSVSPALLYDSSAIYLVLSSYECNTS